MQPQTEDPIRQKQRISELGSASATLVTSFLCSCFVLLLVLVVVYVNGASSANLMNYQNEATDPSPWHCVHTCLPNTLSCACALQLYVHALLRLFSKFDTQIMLPPGENWLQGKSKVKHCSPHHGPGGNHLRSPHDTSRIGLGRKTTAASKPIRRMSLKTKPGSACGCLYSCCRSVPDGLGSGPRH